MTQDPERDRLSGRLSRFAKVGAGLSGAAVSYGANRVFAGDDANARNAKALKAALGGLKGPLMKAAQMFATVPDLLPPEFIGGLRVPQDLSKRHRWGSTPLGFSEIPFLCFSIFSKARRSYGIEEKSSQRDM